MGTQSNWIQAIERWILWTILTGIAWPFGFILSKGLIIVAFPKISDGGEQIVSLVMGGIIIAVAQIIYLSPDIRGRSFWVLVNVLGWVSGAGVTWLFGQAEDFFFKFGWLLAGLIGGLLYGGLQTVGFNPWVTTPISWMSRTAIAWIAAYALGAILLGREATFHLSEYLFISWAVLEPFLFIINLILFPNSQGYRPFERGP